MSLPLRITFEGKNYNFIVLTKKINKDTADVKITLNGEELSISRNSSGEWDILETTISDEPGLFKAIARNVALRYRL